MLQHPQKLGQQYFFPSMNSMNTWTNRIASSLPRRSRRKVKIGNMQKRKPSKHCLQETNTHWRTTWPHVLQSYFTQSDYCTNLGEKSTNCLQLTPQRWNQALEHCFYWEQLHHRLPANNKQGIVCKNIQIFKFGYSCPKYLKIFGATDSAVNVLRAPDSTVKCCGSTQPSNGASGSTEKFRATGLYPPSPFWDPVS